MAGTECDNIGQINIKEEVEESPSASSAGESSSTVSTPSLSSSVSAPLSISVPPTQRVPPTTLSSRQDSTLNGIPYYGSMLSGVKRKSVGADPIRSKLPRSLPSLLSPPLLPSWPSFPHHQSSALGTRVPGAGVGAGYPHAGTRSPAAQDAGQNYEDEWKNIKVVSDTEQVLERCKLLGLDYNKTHLQPNSTTIRWIAVQKSSLSQKQVLLL